jgi:hypothetical protein
VLAAVLARSLFGRSSSLTCGYAGAASSRWSLKSGCIAAWGNATHRVVQVVRQVFGRLFSSPELDSQFTTLVWWLPLALVLTRTRPWARWLLLAQEAGTRPPLRGLVVFSETNYRFDGV